MAKPGRKRTNAPAAVTENAGKFDLANVSIGVATLPPRTRTANATFNPFVSALEDSFAAVNRGEDGGRYIEVPRCNAREITSTIRTAANRLFKEGTPVGVRLYYSYVNDAGEGVEFATLPGGKDAVWTDEDSTNPVTIMFEATKRRGSDKSATNGDTP
jgi:hypothetical protein